MILEKTLSPKLQTHLLQSVPPKYPEIRFQSLFVCNFAFGFYGQNQISKSFSPHNTHRNALIKNGDTKSCSVAFFHILWSDFHWNYPCDFFIRNTWQILKPIFFCLSCLGCVSHKQSMEPILQNDCIYCERKSISMSVLLQSLISVACDRMQKRRELKMRVQIEARIVKQCIYMGFTSAVNRLKIHAHAQAPRHTMSNSRESMCSDQMIRLHFHGRFVFCVKVNDEPMRLFSVLAWQHREAML